MSSQLMAAGLSAAPGDLHCLPILDELQDTGDTLHKWPVSKLFEVIPMKIPWVLFPSTLFCAAASAHPAISVSCKGIPP